MGSAEQLNAKNVFPRYSDVVLPYGEPIHRIAEDAAFTSICDLPDKDTKFTR